MASTLERMRSCTAAMALFFTVLSYFNNTYDERMASMLMDDLPTNEKEVYSILSNDYDNNETFTLTMLERDCNKFLYNHMSEYPWRSFTNPQLKRQFEVVLLDAGYPIISNNFTRNTVVLRNLTRSYSMTTPPEDSTDYIANLKRHWQTWREQLPHSAINQSLHYYVDFYRQVNRTEFERPAEVWYRRYEVPDNLLSHIIHVWEGIKPLYAELHAHLRRVLASEYNMETVCSKQYLPDHLRYFIAEQALHWHKPLIGEPSPDRQLPNLKTELDATKYNVYNFYNNLYNNLYPKFNQTFMAQHFIQQSNENLNCVSKLRTRNNLEFHYCPRVTFSSLLQAHTDLTKFEYTLLRNSTYKAGLNREACPGFADAIGLATHLSASSPDYFQQELSLFSNYTFDNELNLNRLYRQAVRLFFTLPTRLVHELLWADMLDGSVKIEELNKRYWNYMRILIGIDAPLQTRSGTFDMSVQFYEGLLDEHSNPSTLIGTFLGYYIHEQICEKLNSTEINRCWFNRIKALSTLHDLMKFGSTKSWWRIILDVFGEPTKKSLVPQYFAPLHKWLEAKNQEHGVKVGWPINEAGQFEVKCDETGHTGNV